MKEKKEKTIVYKFGMKFVYGISKKFEKDFAMVESILNKGIENINHFDRLIFLQIYKIAFHESGKIENACSCDSTATNCEFCKKMRESNKANEKFICNYCYDFSQEQFKLNSLNRHSLNLLIMKTVEFTEEELKTLSCNVTEIMRINSSGDIENLIHCKNMFRLCKVCNYSFCAMWSKNVPIVQKTVETIGKPSNLILIYSNPIIDGEIKNVPKYFDYTFTVYSTEEKLMEAVNNGAMVCNGQKCKKCGFSCYYGKFPKGSNIAELLK